MVSGHAGVMCAPPLPLEGVTQMNITSSMKKEKPLAEAENFPSAGIIPRLFSAQEE